MKIEILELIDGAKKAKGLTVIIDVFRAFTLEAYLFAQGAEKIYPIGQIEEAFDLKRQHPDWLLFGERGGAIVPGCDYGNSPSAIADMEFTGRTIIHTTSAGTQGIINAKGASEIITGSLTNARAVADYIRKMNPESVSLVAMGNSGIRRANEDVLCAEYIKSILQDEPIDVAKAAAALRTNGGEHFFDENRQHIYPKADFYYSTKIDIFPFVIKIGTDSEERYIAAVQNIVK
ncbi:MAG: 2-phosphosulfolactate phosphatase [Lachnospiraceae bacterium]|nr:2-phosphosulfolactate phosphatase [Lachnospiraceae bacterium]